MAHKHSKGGIGAFLNNLSTESSQFEQTNIQKRIPVDEIQPNPDNFYGLRNIDELAGKIEFSKTIEPLIVRPWQDEDHPGKKYLLIAGHRRKAAWEKLLADGKITDNTIPCIVRTFEPISGKDENGNEETISESELAEAYLVISNNSQRQFRTIDEKLMEIVVLEPFARKMYNLQPENERGTFRQFFAEKILEMSETNYRRLKSMEALAPEIREAVDEQQITFSFATELATLPLNEQRQYMAAVEAGEKAGTYKEIRDWKRQNKEQEEQSELLESKEIDMAESAMSEPDENATAIPEDEMAESAMSENMAETAEQEEFKEPTCEDDEPALFDTEKYNGRAENTDDYAEPYKPAEEAKLVEKAHVTVSVLEMPSDEEAKDIETWSECYIKKQQVSFLKTLLETHEQNYEQLNQQAQETDNEKLKIEAGVQQVIISKLKLEITLAESSVK